MKLAVAAAVLVQSVETIQFLVLAVLVAMGLLLLFLVAA
jgi:hypothetical protein